MKKDFGEGLYFKLGKNGFERGIMRKISEYEYLYGLLYGLRMKITTDKRLDNSDIRVDFLKKDISRVLNTAFPKKYEDKIIRDTFLSCWRGLKKLGCEDLISKEDRGMYKKDLDKYYDDMKKLEEELYSYL